MIEAIKAGHLDRVAEFVRQAPALVSDRTGTISPILTAAYYRRGDVLAVLLRSEPDLDIFEAAAVGNLERVRTLVTAHPDLVRCYSADGWTPLHLACFFSHPQIVKFLLAHGSGVSSRSRNEMANEPLHAAAAGGGNLDIVSALLEHGADPNARQHGGFTPLHAAAQGNHAALAALLLSRGADRHLLLDDGRTAAAIASGQGHEALAEQLS